MKSSIKSIKKSFTSLCGPAQFYVGMSVVGFITYGTQLVEYKHILQSTPAMIIHIFLFIIWTYVLNWICSLKHGTKVAWFLVLIMPILFILLIIGVLMYMIDNGVISKNEIKNIMKESKEEDDIEGNCSSCDA